MKKPAIVIVVVAIVVVCVGGYFILGDGGSKDGDNDNDRRKTDSGSVDVTLKLKERGQVVQGTLHTTTIPVETDYGTLKVPADQVLVIFHRLRIDQNEIDTINALINDLKKEVERKKEEVDAETGEAYRQLVQKGAPAVPYLHKARQSENKEFAARATEALKEIQQAGMAAAPARDVVATKLFTMEGKIDLDEYIIKPAGLAKHEMKLEQVDTLSLRPLKVEELMLPASASTTDANEVAKWRAAEVEEQGWPHPTFDDTKWKSAVFAAYGMTSPQAQQGEFGCYRRCFLLMSEPKSATLSVSAAAYEALVNGINIGAGTSSTHDVSAVLRRGVNVIAVKAKPISSHGHLCIVVNFDFQ